MPYTAPRSLGVFVKIDCLLSFSLLVLLSSADLGTDVKWEASSGDFSPDGKSFTYTINQDGHTDAYLVDRASMRQETLHCQRE